MSKIDDGGPAEIISMRDWFAAHALPSTLSASSYRDGSYDYVAAAVGAYQVADAMIAARIADLRASLSQKDGGK